MKIGINFHTFDNCISGVEYYSLGLIRSLLEVGTENKYVVFTNNPSLLKKHFGDRENLHIETVSYITSRLKRICWEHLMLPRISQRMGLDVVHFPHYICPALGVSVPYVATIHDTIAIDNPRWCTRLNAFYYRIALRNTIRKAAKIIAVSSDTKSCINKHFPGNESKVETVYPGVDDIFFRRCTAEQMDSIKNKYHLPDKYILFVGNIEPKKNVGLLLDAFEKLQQNGFEHKLVIAGGRSWKCSKIQKRIDSLVEKQNAVRLGYVKRLDLPAIYKMAGIFIFPSLYEGFGFCPLEAMAAGTAVICTLNGAMAETIAGGVMELKRNDSSELADLTTALLSNKVKRNHLIETGKKIARKFRWENHAQKLLSIYTLKGKKCPR